MYNVLKYYLTLTALWGCRAVIFFFFAAVYTVQANSEEFKLGLLHGNEEVFAYEISVLKLALAQHSDEHSLKIIPLEDINQGRVLLNLQNENNSFNVFFTGFSAEREEALLQVDFPISRGLLGHRIFIIRKQDQLLFENITSLNNLKQRLVIGSGIGWPDTAIFQAAGFKVQTAVYENLWQMLSRGRYHAFNRGIHEAYVEIQQRNPDHPDLIVNDNVMIVYPFDYFFYLNKKDFKRHEIIKDGLNKAFENGSFMENFNTHPMIMQVINDAKPALRKKFQIPNPLITDRIKAITAKYWHQF